tara:strand:+ start:241 stop:834 length:594 start_codon:yes stop_codon:yes gene_type:complete
MTVLELPTFTESAPQVGPRLKFDPLELKDAMARDPHALSNILIKDSNWIFFTRKGLEVSAPIRALIAAEELGLTRKELNDEFPEINIMDVLENVNDTLISQKKKPVTVGSVLSNLSKAVRYVQAAFGICLIPDRKKLKIQVSNGIATQQNIDKYFARALPQMQKIAAQLENAKALNFEVNVFTDKQQEAIAALAPAK